MGFLISVFLLLFLSIVCCLAIFKGIEKFINNDDADFFMTLLLLFASLACLYPPYRLLRLLNQKNVYITKDKLFIEKYLGKTIVLPLGTFYTYRISTIWGFTTGMSSAILLHKIECDNKLSFIIQSFIEPFGTNNLDELYSLLLPKIEDSLLELDNNAYAKLKTQINIVGNINPQIDFNKIDKLREEQSNA